MATITFHRVPKWQGRFAKMQVSRDGIPIGSVSWGKDLVVQVEPGVHVIEVKMSWVRAQAQVVVADPDERLVMMAGMVGPFEVFIDGGEPGSVSSGMSQAGERPSRRWWWTIRKGWLTNMYTNPAVSLVTFLPACVAILVDRGEPSGATVVLSGVFLIAVFLNPAVCFFLVRRGRRTKAT